MANRNADRKNQNFWDKEYKIANHLAISENPSEDLIKFTRHLLRQNGKAQLNPMAKVLDLGCGNGRNLIYLANTFGIRGIGYDISTEGIKLAKKLSEGLPTEYEVRSIIEPLPLPDSSQTFVLDMMTSHFLDQSKRKNLLSEIARVLKPGGWFFWKTFLLDEDLNAQKLLRENPANESGSYIHPKIGVPEHVFTEEEIANILEKDFIIHKIHKSHKHISHGKAGKRRSVSVYAEKL